MRQVRRFFQRIATLLRSGRAEHELAREIQAHLQLLEDQFVARGMSRDEARYAARRTFGGVEQVKEAQRDARAFRWLAGWPMDLKLGVRMLAKSPGLTLVAVTALAVAIGAGAAYLEFTRDLLHPSLDMPGTERLVGIRAWNAQARLDETFLIRDFETWRAKARLIEDLGAARPFPRDLTTADGRTESVRGVEISASAFRLMPVAPLLGRPLTGEDERAGAPPVVVIGESVWRGRFHADPNVVGTLARLGSTPHTIVGVMPGRFGFPMNQNVWVPLKRTEWVQEIFGRLTPGTTTASAEAELAGMVTLGTLAERASVRVRPYLDSVVGGDRESAEIAVVRAINLVFILLLGICGANVATLVFARTAMREGEITVRTALGAGRGRISAQLFAEALVLCVLAAGAGLVAARLVGGALKGYFERGVGPVPFWWNDALGYQTIAYALLLAVVAAAIVGLIPAMKATGRELQGRIRDAASGTSTMKFGGIWTAIIVAQASITVMFLAAVVALGQSGNSKSAGEDVIYSRENLLTARVVVDDPDAGRTQPAGAGTLRALADRLRLEPGVAAVSYATAVPGTIWEQFIFELESPELQAVADAHTVTEDLWSDGARVAHGFFETAGIPLVSGRTFTLAETSQAAPVAVVDEAFVSTVLGGRSAIGVRLRERARNTDDQPHPWLEIVGVVKDATTGSRTGPDDATVYRVASPDTPSRLLVRVDGSAPAVAQRVYAAALLVNPDIRLDGLRTMAQVALEAALPERIFLRAFAVIAAISLLLATAGIYALISFTLSRRTREIGIRVALGAAPGRVIASVFARAARQVGLGVAVGALPGMVIMQSLTGDVGSLTTAGAIVATLGVCAFVLIVALVSCTVPLRRALRIEPMLALRSNG